MSDLSISNPVAAMPIGAPMVVYLTIHSDAIGQAAQRLARSTMLPESLRIMPKDSPEERAMKVADVGILFARCLSSGEDIIALAQQVYFIGGRSSIGSAYVVARAQQLGIIHGAPRYTVTGEWPKITVTASAVLAADGQIYSASVSMEEAQADGWAGRNPKYKAPTTAANMLHHRAATRLIRQIAPGVLLGMGMPVAEEAMDYVQISQPVAEVVKTPSRPLPPHMQPKRPALPDHGEHAPIFDVEPDRQPVAFDPSDIPPEEANPLPQM